MLLYSQADTAVEAEIKDQGVGRGIWSSNCELHDWTFIIDAVHDSSGTVCVENGGVVCPVLQSFKMIKKYL